VRAAGPPCRCQCSHKGTFLRLSSPSLLLSSNPNPNLQPLATQRKQSTCNSPDFRKRLDGILHIIERKHRLDARVKSIGAKAAFEFVGSPKGKGRFLSDMEPIHGIKHLFFVLESA